MTNDDLIVMTDPEEFKTWLFEQNLAQTALLLMSSGNYGGLDFDKLKEARFKQSPFSSTRKLAFMLVATPSLKV